MKELNIYKSGLTKISGMNEAGLSAIQCSETFCNVLKDKYNNLNKITSINFVQLFLRCRKYSDLKDLRLANKCRKVVQLALEK